MDLGLSKHVAVIVGGASGIGLAISRAFVSEGAQVVVWDIADDVAAVAEQISHGDGCAAGMSVDITDSASVNAALEKTCLRFDRLDHLVHAAAVGSGRFGFPFTNLDPTDWQRVLDVNMMGMVHVAHGVAPHMMEHGSGTMVFISSVAGQIGSPTDPPYSASKAANINFAQCIARDLAPHGIRVNTVCPGMVKTPLNESVWRAWNEQQAPQGRMSYGEWAEQKIRDLVPLGRWQQPEDIANMVVFLSSNRAEQITGQTINVDGGYVMHS